MIDSINTSIIDSICAYMLNVYPVAIQRLKGDALDSRMMLSMPDTVRLRLIEYIMRASPQLDLTDALIDLNRDIVEQQSREKVDDFDVDRDLLVHAIKHCLDCGLKRRQHMAEHQIVPMIQLPMSDVPNFKSRSSHSTKEDRLKERAACRQFFKSRDPEHLNKSIEQKLIYLMEHNNLSNKISGDTSQHENKAEEYFSNKKMFGWLNLDKLLLRTEISFKKLFNLYIRQIFDHMTKLQTFDFDIINEFRSNTNPKSESANTDHSNDKLHCQAKYEVKHTEETFTYLYVHAYEAYRYSMISLCAFLYVVDHFSTLFTHHATFVKDIIGTSDDVSMLRLALTDEIRNLDADDDTIDMIDDVVDAGLFRVNMCVFKKSVKNQIDENRKMLKKTMMNDMKSLIQVMEDGICQIVTVCTMIPGQVDEYIDLKVKLESEEFRAKIVKLKDSSVMFDLEVEAMNMLQENYDYEHYLKKLYLNTQLKDCFARHQQFTDSFRNARLNFYDEISLHRLELIHEFKAM
jgi:hypothetical protein